MKKKSSAKKSWETIDFEINSKAFQGPFTCACGKKTKKVKKKDRHKGIEFDYITWQCPACKQEYSDWHEPGKMDMILSIQTLLSGKAINIERALNYDGNAFFFRFPKDLTSGWDKEGSVNIKILNSRSFLVEVKA